MRHRSHFFFMLIVALATTPFVHATQTPNINTVNIDKLEICYINSQAAARTCLRKLNVESEKHLQQAYENANATINKWDEDARYKALALKNLKASQAVFLKYRLAQCVYEASLGGGAVGLESLKLRCVFLQNKQRIETLQNSVASLITIQTK